MNNTPNQPVILVVEDRDEDLSLIQRAFSQLGFDTPVQYLRDGEEAIAYLWGRSRFVNRDEFPMPTVMLLDLKMPRKNGFEVLEWVQQQTNLTELRTIVLTTSEDIFEVHKAYRLGAASFLTKPLNFTEFKDAIQMVHNYWMMLNRPPNLERTQKGSLVLPPGQNAPQTDLPERH